MTPGDSLEVLAVFAVCAVVGATITAAALGVFSRRSSPATPGSRRSARSDRAQPPSFALVVPAQRHPAAPWYPRQPDGRTLYVQTRHVRRIGPEGINPRDGAPTRALCGYSMGPRSPEGYGEDFTPHPAVDGEPALESCFDCILEYHAALALERYAHELGVSTLPLRIRHPGVVEPTRERFR